MRSGRRESEAVVFLWTDGTGNPLSDGKEVGVLNTPRGGQFKDWFISIAFSPDEKFLAAVDIAGLIHVWAFED